jgi:hypothetical protein
LRVYFTVIIKLQKKDEIQAFVPPSKCRSKNFTTLTMEWNPRKLSYYSLSKLLSNLVVFGLESKLGPFLGPFYGIFLHDISVFLSDTLTSLTSKSSMKVPDPSKLTRVGFAISSPPSQRLHGGVGHPFCNTQQQNAVNCAWST